MCPGHEVSTKVKASFKIPHELEGGPVRMKPIAVVNNAELLSTFDFYPLRKNKSSAAIKPPKLSPNSQEGKQCGTTLIACGVNGWKWAGCGRKPHIPVNCSNAQEANCQFDGILFLSN